jgi:hypothetical protein
MNATFYTFRARSASDGAVSHRIERVNFLTLNGPVDEASFPAFLALRSI